MQNKIKAGMLIFWCAFAAADDDIVQPYRVPTFTGEPTEFREIQPAIKPAKRIDGDLIFRTIMNCYPVKPWGLDIRLRGGMTYKDTTESTINTSDLSRYYVGVVANMPIYSEPEIDKARTREYRRRKETAATIQQLISALSTKRRAERLLGLYVSLEKRAQLRVAKGLTDTKEQIGYLEKVAIVQSELDTANAQIEGARITLVGQCRPEVADRVNAFLASEIH